MGAHEIWTRLRQETGKRIDLALCRAGWQPDTHIVDFGRKGNGKFFFSGGDLQQRVQLLQTHLPSEVESAIREADDICCHNFRLLGYDNVSYASEIDWHLDAVHNKHAPLKPWFKVDFLNFDEVGDHKIIWELNRHQHLVTLAKAWCFTKDDRYIQELTAQWYSWKRTNPYPLGINWASSLEVAFRSLSWLWVSHLLVDCTSLPSEFKNDLFRALALNGHYIERFLSTYFSPNTHLLGEAIALFFIGMLCPQIHSAERWQCKGWNILLEEMQRQVRPDGTYFEQALYYHVYALDFFLYARQLAVCNQTTVPASFDQRLMRMLDFLQTLSQAGAPQSFGDDDGGRMFNPRRNRTEHLTDPLALGAITYRRTDLTAASLTEESIWLFGERALAMQSLNRNTARTEAFEDGGIYVMAGIGGHNEQLIIDAGPQGTENSGHGHADALSICASADGQHWLVDPGTWAYISHGNERDHFRGTSAHNTLRVDGLDQAIPVGPFAWGSLPDVRAERWLAGGTFSFFVGSHTGYCRLPDPVVHRRYVFHIPGDFWLIRDVVEGQEPHQLEFFWHYPTDVVVTNEEGIFVARRPFLNSQFVLLPLRHHDWHCELQDSFVSSAYGIREQASILRVSARIPLPTECATLLISEHSSSSRVRNFLSLHNAGDSVRVYEHTEPNKTQALIFADTSQPSWQWGQWISDAKILYYSLTDGHIAHFVLCDGSFAISNGRSVITHPRHIDRFEWQEQGGMAKAFSSDPSTMESFVEESLQTCVSVSS